LASAAGRSSAAGTPWLRIAASGSSLFSQALQVPKAGVMSKAAPPSSANTFGPSGIRTRSAKAPSPRSAGSSAGSAAWSAMVLSLPRSAAA